MTMKKQLLIIIGFCILFFNVSFAQDKAECEKVVTATMNAINTKNVNEIEKYLSHDFTISGYKEEIAKMILPQLVTQLNDEVLDYKLKNEEQTEVLSLYYDVTYKKIGKQTSKFVFDKNNQIIELELLSIEVKTLKNEELKITFPDQPYIKIPFKRAGNLIAVEVELENIKRTFIIDNGAPKLILNSHYISNQDAENQIKLSDAQGVNGSISGIDIIKIEKFDFYGIKIEDQDVLSMNLLHLEKSLETEEIYGLIGFEIYKDYDLLFDYEGNTITLIRPEYMDTYIDSNFGNHKRYEVPVEMSAHIATVNVKIGNTELKMGLDCGAEANLIQEKQYKSLKKHLKKRKKTNLVGAENIETTVYSCKVLKMQLEEKQFQDVKTVFSNINHLNEGYKINIDGLFGFEILSKQRTILSYQNTKLIFIE